MALMGLVLGPAWFGGLVLLWAPFASVARVMTGVHYLSDIVVGAVVGLLIGGGILATQYFWLHLLMRVVQVFLQLSPFT